MVTSVLSMAGSLRTMLARIRLVGILVLLYHWERLISQIFLYGVMCRRSVVVRLASMCHSAGLGKRCTHVSDLLGSSGEIIRGEFKPRKSFRDSHRCGCEEACMKDVAGLGRNSASSLGIRSVWYIRSLRAIHEKSNKYKMVCNTHRLKNPRLHQYGSRKEKGSFPTIAR